MQAVRIGILDREKEYAEALAARLSRLGAGKWMLAAFTNRSALETYLQHKSLDLLAGTDLQELEQLEETYQGLTFLWLTEQQDKVRKKEDKFIAVNRYQSVQAIGKAIQDIVIRLQVLVETQRPLVAVYSPVGRCGKTTLALQIVQSNAYGRWLYIGMEDYSSFAYRQEEIDEKAVIPADEFLFYLKERQREKLLSFVGQDRRVIGSARSVFDTKQIDREDMVWLREVFQDSGFSGVIFDIGTGVLRDYEIFTLFDYIIIPYLKEEGAMLKREHFEWMLEVYGIEEIKERMWFINMSDAKEVKMKIRGIFGGGS
ncbi:MAG: hypothetical protein K2H34_00645 [Lachnospiraceae bacterium]|nr:hypothetical protein [Lachnospiraceae bacterium]